MDLFSRCVGGGDIELFLKLFDVLQSIILCMNLAHSFLVSFGLLFIKFVLLKVVEVKQLLVVNLINLRFARDISLFDLIASH